MKYKLNLKKTMALTIAIMFIASSTLVGCKNQNNNTANVENNITYTITEEGVDFKMPNAPTTPAWTPEQLLQEDIKEKALYNKSLIPLKDRVSKDRIYPVNSTQNKDTRLVALSIMNSNTSGNIPHGSNNFNANTFSYWQYLDKLVYWGGSAGEGIIVPPTPDVVDSAHKNGVPVLGTIFFPPLEYGGKVEWLDQFLQKDEQGNFIIIDKLIEVSTEFGFEGWFINQETDPAQSKTMKPEQYATLFKEFLVQFKQKSNNSIDIIWYDAMTNEGKVEWQNQLNEKNKDFIIDEKGNKISDDMFLNFWWTTDKLAPEQLLKKSNEYAKTIGYENKNLLAGIDMQANGTTTPIKWDLLENGKDTQTSIGLYCPSWSFFSSNGDLDQFQNKEARIYVNEFSDPSKDSQATGTEWRGMSKFITEKTVLNSLPFNTNFSMGNGYNYFINGEKVSSLDWNNRSLADVMPTYRWIIEEDKNSTKASIDYSTAYYSGNSIKLLSDLKANEYSTIKLFSADLKIEENTEFLTYAKADSEVNLELKLTFHDGEEEAVFQPDKTLNENWQTISYDLSPYVGKSIKTISYKISSTEDKNVAINLGGISIKDGTQKAVVTDVTSVKIDDSLFEEEDTLAGVNLSWEATDSKDLKAYEIYRKNADGSLSLLGATLNNRFFVNSLQRTPETMETEFVVMAVNKDDIRGKSASTKLTWPDNTVPKAKFKADKTLIAPNEEVQFTNMSNKLSESFEWTFEGANIETSTDENPVVKYEKEGTYTVKLKAKNSKGEDEFVAEKLITVTSKASQGLENFALNAKTEASSFVNENEAPQFAVDGDKTKKWCAVGQDKHNITIDLGEVIQIARLDVYHAEAGGESPDMNTEEYMLEVSEDGVNFTKVLEVEKNTLGTTSDAFKPVNARYVKFTTLKPTQTSDSTARIYEIEVYGLK
ncbi:endo-beta-N-acetylglucosaminidase [[Clostridium] colinum]|uniref:endo-beta-N-acetylglucosaminidase n=1 Tax=[Clostridium] colinum TaxID=36835 RepID=UPI002025371E|nr:discoidin domain-containing protein [[Clostridium] colinum]